MVFSFRSGSLVGKALATLGFISSLALSLSVSFRSLLASQIGVTELSNFETSLLESDTGSLVVNTSAVGSSGRLVPNAPAGGSDVSLLCLYIRP